jgi:hypothetical protein
LGWLLWSFRRIDIQQLSKEIKKLTGATVHLRYQNISTGIGTDKESNTVRALHVVANQKEAESVSNIFQNMYSFDKTVFPLGIIMRFIPHVLRVGSDKKQKIMKFRARQDTFLRAIENSNRPMSATSWEVLALDKETVGIGTLRQEIMTIKSKQKKDEPLFLSVDTSFFRTNEVIFTYLPRHETEARAFVTNMVPYFLHKFKNVKLHTIFQAEAIERAQNIIWNADTEEIVTQSDLYLENSGDVNDNFDLIEVLGIEEVSKPVQVDEIGRVERLFSGEDATSVGSLFTQAQNINQSKDVESTLKAQSNNISMSNKSVSTTLTIEEVDKRMTTMTSELEQIKQMLQKLTGESTEQNQTQNMVIDEPTGQKRKAGESNSSACQGP